MAIVAAAFAGLVQGVTEFLPVSSSGHLVLLHEFLGFNTGDDAAFDVALHVATLLAVVWYFRHELRRYLRAWAGSWRGVVTADARVGWQLAVGTLPALAVGWWFGDVIERTLRGPLAVAIALGVVGVGMLLIERTARPLRTVRELRFSDALVIGVAQALALIPGVSRSGITIIAGLAIGLQRREAARFSFLLAVPVMAGAAAVKLRALEGLAAEGLPQLTVAFVAAAVAGWWAIRFLLRWLERSTLKPFAYYRILLSFAILAWWYVR